MTPATVATRLGGLKRILDRPLECPVATGEAPRSDSVAEDRQTVGSGGLDAAERLAVEAIQVLGKRSREKGWAEVWSGEASGTQQTVVVHPSTDPWRIWRAIAIRDDDAQVMADISEYGARVLFTWSTQPGREYKLWVFWE